MIHRILAGLVLVAFTLAACATSVPVDGATMSFAQEVAAFDAKAKSDLRDFGAVSLAAGKSACGYVNEASGLYAAVKPALLVAGALSPEAAGTEAAVVLSTRVACGLIDAANPAAPATPQVAAAIGSVLATVPAVKSLLDASPAVAAAATAPAAPAL